ncbi:MAG: Ldh family oxidoreductase [Clostridia bacterium]|jgi:ureidoglycolate dehydrogenase (NAD+)|nr:Ldh family oxidoreductase [Clostridia bacterium]
MKTITEKDLKVFCVSALVQNGMNEQDAAITADVLAGTDALGCFSHGTKNLRMYIEKIKVGALDPKAQPEVVKEGPAFALMDAHDAMGMVASVKGMAKAMDLAKKSGVGFVTMKNSCHFGAAGYYANMAAEQGMVGIAMSNTDPNMAVPGGKSMVVGNSPIAYAAPAKGHDPVMLDIAMSATAALKINQAKIDKKPIPDTWLVDTDGVPTSDPGFYGTGGALQPMGAHKGYGLSILVDILSGLLSGGATSKDIPSWCFELEEKNKASHAFLAFDIGAIQTKDEYENAMDAYIDNIKQSPKAKGSGGIYMPGEIEFSKKKKADKTGIPLTDDVVQSLEQLANSSGLKLNWK